MALLIVVQEPTDGSTTPRPREGSLRQIRGIAVASFVSQKRSSRYLGRYVAGLCLVSSVFWYSTEMSAAEDSRVPAESADIWPELTAAPNWPFRGMIGYFGTDIGAVPVDIPDDRRLLYESDGLQFRDSDTGKMTWISLRPEMLCGPGHMVADADGVGVRYSESGSHSVYLWIPWGDYPYPLFRVPDQLDALASTDSWFAGLQRVTFGRTEIRAEAINESEFQVWKPDDAQFYRFTDQLVPSGRVSRKPVSSIDVDEENLIWAPIVQVAGSDGRHYGIRVIPSEPACVPQMTYLIDARTGEIPLCGWSFLGPILVNPNISNTSIEVPELPNYGMRDLDSGRCRRVLDLRDFDPRGYGR